MKDIIENGRFPSLLMQAATSVFGTSKNYIDFDVADWISFIQWAEKAGILINLFSSGNRFGSSLAYGIAKRKVEQYSKRQSIIIDALCKFSAEARRQQLRFVALKGPTLSYQLYGTYYARSYSDVDILVDPLDLPKADYVARKCGYSQPAEYYSLRGSGALCDDLARNWRKADFVIKRRLDVDTLSEYVSLGFGDFPVILDIHDRLDGLSSDLLNPFLWGTSQMDVDGERVNALDRISSFAYLVLCAYGDSEGYRPNSTGGFLGLKMYVDLLAAVCRFGQNEIETSIDLLGKVDRSTRLEVVLRNCDDLFPHAFDDVDAPRTPSIWGDDFRQRIRQRGSRSESAKGVALALLSGSNREYVASVGEASSLRWSVTQCLEVRCDLNLTEEGVELRWLIPEALLDSIEYYVLQVRLYPLSTSKAAEFRFNLFQEASRFRCFMTASSRFSRSGKASKAHKDVEACISEGNDRARKIVCAFVEDPDLIEAYLHSDGVAIDGGIFKSHSDFIYHETWRANLTINGNPVVGAPLDR